MTMTKPWESKICRSCFSQKPVCVECERCADCDLHHGFFDVKAAFGAPTVDGADATATATGEDTKRDE